MSPALLGGPDPQLPASKIEHEIIGHSVGYVFLNSPSHVVKLGVGVTALSKAPTDNASKILVVGEIGVERVFEQSTGN
jgi:hypothetical protein